MAKFRKKPVVIEAWTVAELNRAAEHEWKALPQSVRDAYEEGGWVFGAYGPLSGIGERGIYIPTLEGSLFASAGDMVIRGVKGEFYPCKPDIFAATYEPVVARLSKPTVSELEAILNDEGTRNVTINPDGSVSTVAASPEGTK